MRNRITQKEAIFYQLYKNWQQSREQYIPVFKLMGDVHVPELGQWGFVSHEVAARCSDLRRENPELMQHIEIKGKAPGVVYYGHRLNPAATPDMIKDESLRKFHKRISRKPVTPQMP